VGLMRIRWDEEMYSILEVEMKWVQGPSKLTTLDAPPFPALKGGGEKGWIRAQSYREGLHSVVGRDGLGLKGEYRGIVDVVQT